MRIKFRDKPCDVEVSQYRHSLGERERARTVLESAEAAFAPYKNETEYPGSEAERLRHARDAARETYEGLRFAVADSMPDIPHSVRLRQLNQRHEEVYRRKA
jgi:hypothetical protein